MTTPVLRLKLNRLEAQGDTTNVHWWVAVSDGQQSSTGVGVTRAPDSISELSGDAIVQAAIDAVGGPALLDSLYAYHANNLRPIRELAVQDDWLVAFEFFRNKTGQDPVTREDALQGLRDGFAALHVKYNHSIYNLTTGGHWSHTFAYIHGGALFHVKVRDGEVTEWYESEPAIQVDGQSVAWVAMDLQTGALIEYYRTRPGDAENTLVMEKFDSATGQLSTSTVHGVMGQIVLPPDFESDLSAQQFARREHVFGYATKSYGRIVEYVAV